MGVPENIDALLVANDITQETLARIAGVSPAAVSGWRHGSIPRQDAVQKICDFFRLKKDDITSDRYGLAAKEHGTAPKLPPNAIFPPPSRPAYMPLLGRVHAGDAQEPDVINEKVSVPYEIRQRHQDAYLLEVEGNCMNRVYPEGCLVAVDRHAEPRNGSIAVVSIDGADYVMRRLYRGATTMILSPDSWEDGHEDIVISSNDDHTVEFVGVVVWYQASCEME